MGGGGGARWWGLVECVIGMGYFLRQLVTKDSRVLDYVNGRETSQPTPAMTDLFYH